MKNPRRIIEALGEKYTTARPQQVEAVSYLYENRAPLMMAELPVGSGKSAIAVALGEMMNSPLTAVVTATLSLQDQYTRDFGCLPLKGRSNFRCTLGRNITAAEGPCIFDGSSRCESEFYEQEEAFEDAEVVVTNYALYFSDLLSGNRFKRRRPHLLVCDEGHRLLDYLTAAETVEIDGKLVEECQYQWDTSIATIADARNFAESITKKVKGRALSRSLSGKQTSKLTRLYHQLEKASEASEELVVTRTGSSFSASPIWPVTSAALLTSSTNYLLLMSATLYGGTFLQELLGFAGTRSTYLSLPSMFEKERWPVYYKPVVKLSAKSSSEDWQKISEKCHELMHSRPRDKGIIHVSSYAQVDKVGRAILSCAECRRRLVLLRMGERRAEAVERFRNQDSAWVCHPGLREGESFDDDACRTQIIAKVPWPDLGDPLNKLRMETQLGKDYFYASTAAQIAQAAGRGMRHEADHAETFIIDGTFARLYDQHRAAFPEWFRKQLR